MPHPPVLTGNVVSLYLRGLVGNVLSLYLWERG
jgi:hypothetical protein